MVGLTAVKADGILYKGAGQNNGATLVTVDSHSFAAGDIAAGDTLEILIFVNVETGGTAPSWKLSISDVSSPGDLTSFFPQTTPTRANMTVWLNQDIDSGSELNSWWLGNIPNAGYNASARTVSTGDANVLTTAFTLDLNIDCNSTTVEWYWIIKVLRAP